MSIDEVSRAIGELNANVKTVMAALERVEDTVGEINRDGCGPCREHETRLTTLERKPGNGNGNSKAPIRQVILWATAAGAFISGLITGVKQLAGQ